MEYNGYYDNIKKIDILKGVQPMENLYPEHPAAELHTEIFPCSPLDMLFFEIQAKIPEPKVLAAKFFELPWPYLLDRCSLSEDAYYTNSPNGGF